VFIYQNFEIKKGKVLKQKYLGIGLDLGQIFVVLIKLGWVTMLGPLK
jgi:hypothetical protein